MASFPATGLRFFWRGALPYAMEERHDLGCGVVLIRESEHAARLVVADVTTFRAAIGDEVLAHLSRLLFIEDRMLTIADAMRTSSTTSVTASRRSRRNLHHLMYVMVATSFEMKDALDSAFGKPRIDQRLSSIGKQRWADLKTETRSWTALAQIAKLRNKVASHFDLDVARKGLSAVGGGHAIVGGATGDVFNSASEFATAIMLGGLDLELEELTVACAEANRLARVVHNKLHLVVLDVLRTAGVNISDEVLSVDDEPESDMPD